MSTKSMHIEKMDGGFSTTAHPENNEKGNYRMPESKVHKSHGSVMHDVHEMVHGHGSAEPAEDEEPCPMCAAGGPKKGEAAPKPGPGAKGKSGKSTKGESPARSASILSEKAAKVAKKG